DVAGRIMRIEPCSVNLFFKENCSKVTVWLGCEQRGAIFVNYCLLCVFSHPTAILLSYRMKFGI
ncbi:TPA: hypothetical protein ACP4ZN_003990, partial [Escherichia coli]